MSAISFQSKSQGTVELRGSERAYMMSVQQQYGYQLNTNHAQIDPHSTTATLNACLAQRSDTLSLLMRIHAQCENHAWIDGPNRAWIASIIEKGRQSGLYRPAQGWEELAAFLRVRADEPVFMSYSVCENFPSYELLRNLMPYEKWDRLPSSQQWELAEQVLRQESISELFNPDAPFSRELRPDNWQEYFFG